MAKQKISKDIEDAKDILKEVMQQNLSNISDLIIQQTMRSWRKLPKSQKLKATKAITDIGVGAYKKDLLETMSIIAENALIKVRKEVPKAKNVKLAENQLPAKSRNRLKNQADNLVDTQKNDLDKSIVMQFSSSVNSTDSESILEQDLYDSAEKFIGGRSVDGSADITSGNVVNEMRGDFFADPEVQDQLDAFMFMNDDPITPLCQDLSNGGEGKIFALDDAEAQRYIPPLHFNAILEGQFIHTSMGRVLIEDIKIGDFVKTHTGSYCKVYEVMNKFEDKEYFEIELEDGKIIKLTGEHPVLCGRGWIRTDELILGDNVITFEDIEN